MLKHKQYWTKITRELGKDKVKRSVQARQVALFTRTLNKTAEYKYHSIGMEEEKRE